MSTSQATEYPASPSQGVEEQNKQLLRRLIEEGFNKGDLSVVDEIIAPDIKEHQFFPPGHPEGRDGVKDTITDLRRLLGDFHLSIDYLVAEGDMVWTMGRGGGVHQSEFFGLQPTGRRTQIWVIDVCRFENGQMVEHWGVPDRLHLMAQLGMLPRPPQA